MLPYNELNANCCGDKIALTAEFEVFMVKKKSNQ
jgi:hypothetical protein